MPLVLLISRSIKDLNLKTKLIHLSTNKVYGNLEYLKTKQLKKNIFQKFKIIDEKINLDFHFLWMLKGFSRSIR